MKDAVRHLGWLAWLPAGALAAANEGGVRLTESPLSTGHLLETVGGLLLVLAMIVALGWGVKRMGRIPGAGRGGVQIIGGVSLGPRERAVLLSVEGTRLLVGVAPGRVQALHVFGTGEAAVAAIPADHAFENTLQQAVDKGAAT